jgi:hypothetical protein
MIKAARFGLISLTAAILTMIPAGCGGGGDSNDTLSMGMTLTTSATFGDLTGDTDPDGDGTILVEYFLISNKSLKLDISMEFSRDGGVVFSDCTEDESELLGGEPNPTEGLKSLASSPAGVRHVFAWDSDAPKNLPGVNLNCVMLRITIDGGDSALSPYFTVINDPGDGTPPGVDGFTAIAVENASNDILTITFDEPVLAADAEDPGCFSLENPLGEELPLPAEAALSYDPVPCRTTIVLEGDVNLRYGSQAQIQVSGVHDLVGNEIVTVPDGICQATVGGDGETIPDDQPDITAAVYYGTGSPRAGRSLILIFNEDMDLENGGTFDAADVEFWNMGETIGVGSPIPIYTLEAESKAVRIVLGAMPSFVPGVSRINVSGSNDVIMDLAGNVAYIPPDPNQDDYVTIIPMEYQPPVIDLLTISGIPECLNGDGSAGGTIQAKRTGITIDLEYHDEGGAGVDPETITIVSSTPVIVDGDAVDVGADLVPYLTEIAADGEGASFALPAGMEFDTGQTTLSATVDDIVHNRSETAEYTFKVIVPSNGQLPFRTTVNPSQVWNLVFGRDLYDIDVGGTYNIVVDAVRRANGKADFDEDLVIFGFNCTVPIDVPGTSMDSNEFMQSLVIESIKNELSAIFEGANIEFTDSASASFPGNYPQVDYSSYSHSLMAIGGDSDLTALGVAFIDRCNRKQDNNRLYKGSAPYNPGTNLGVFPTRIFIYEVNGSAYGLFRLTFDHFIPGRGIPVGEGIDDEAILMDMAGTGPPVGGIQALRRDAILTAVERFGRYIAVVAGHEMGHSMGVAVNGTMPNGLYGGNAAHFPGSTDNHISLTTFPELFKTPNVNIMIPATNFTYTNAEGTRFNGLNKAYLREEIFYNN